MDVVETMRRAAKIAESAAVIANTIEGAGTATYRPHDFDGVDFYIYDIGNNGRLDYHFRFERNRDFLIRDVLGNMTVYRTNLRDRALANWANILMDYAV